MYSSEYEHSRIWCLRQGRTDVSDFRFLALGGGDGRMEVTATRLRRVLAPEVGKSIPSTRKSIKCDTVRDLGVFSTIAAESRRAWRSLQGHCTLSESMGPILRDFPPKALNEDAWLEI